MPKRYIEDVLPLGGLNKCAQWGGGVGSLNVMHPYFARRPLTASRAMTLAALVDAPRTEEERKNLEEVMIGLSREEWPDEPTPNERARSISIRLYGVENWGQMFNDRQALALITLGQLLEPSIRAHDAG